MENVTRYRLIVHEVEAEKVAEDNLEVLALWCKGRILRSRVGNLFDPGPMVQMVTELNVATLNGIKVARFGDYLVKLGDGTFDVIKAKDFEAKYERVD